MKMCVKMAMKRELETGVEMWGFAGTVAAVLVWEEEQGW
jgi:hypothetical protein